MKESDFVVAMLVLMFVIFALILVVAVAHAAPLFPSEPDGPPMTSDRGTCVTGDNSSFDYYIDAYGLTPQRNWTFVGRYVGDPDGRDTEHGTKGYARLAFRPDTENIGAFTGSVFVRDFHNGENGSYTTTEEWPAEVLSKGYCALLDPMGWAGENRDESRGKYGPES